MLATTHRDNRGVRWRLAAAIAIAVLTGCGDGEDSPLEDLRGRWNQPSELIDYNDECSGQVIGIDDRTLRNGIGRTLLFACYRVDHVNRTGSIYTLRLQEIDSLTVEELQDNIIRGVPLRQIACDETTANRNGMQVDLRVSVMNDVMIVLAAPPSLALEGSTFGRLPAACGVGGR